jgi:hypothetical protein
MVVKNKIVGKKILKTSEIEMTKEKISKGSTMMWDHHKMIKLADY